MIEKIICIKEDYLETVNNYLENERWKVKQIVPVITASCSTGNFGAYVVIYKEN